VTFREKHALITGGSSGIGLAIATALARHGARVSLVSRDPARLGSAREAVLSAVPGAAVAVAPADVSREAEVDAAVASAERSHGPVDILVTSAGVARPGHFGELPASEFERAIAVNYLGTLYAVRAVVPGMRARGAGALVLISSGAGLVGLFGYTAYAPSKFAVRGLAESLRGELAPEGVAVTIVYPPDTDTPQLAEESLTKPAETRAITAGGGLWSADDVARATLEAVARGRFAVAPGAPLSAVLWLHSLIAPFLRWHFDRRAARARRP
jgi:3-dehydrosphinganine reductase